jgi:hypothetical protein
MSELNECGYMAPETYGMLLEETVLNSIIKEPFELVKVIMPKKVTMPDKKPESVVLSKEAFNRAMNCRQFLWDIPNEVLALKGINCIVDLILACLRTKLQETAPLASLADEIQNQIGMLSHAIAGYTPRSTLEEFNSSARELLIDQFFTLDYLFLADRMTAFPMIQRERDTIGRFLFPCPECNGTGNVLTSVTDEESITQLCQACNGMGFDRSKFDRIKEERNKTLITG